MTTVADVGPVAVPAPKAMWSLSPAVVHIMWRREMLRYRRDRSQVFGGISRTILWLLILGYGLGAALREIDGYAYSVYVLPGVVVLNVLYASMQCAISIVYDRNVGLLREVMVSPAPVLSVSLGKLLGGATISIFQGSIPLLVAFGTSIFTLVRGWFPNDPSATADRTITALERVFPDLLSLDTVWTLLLAWGAMFLMGIFMTALGVVIATRLKTFEGFGAISNGIIQPFYFLSGSIFPLRGVVGGVGFLQLPDTIRRQLVQYGVYVTGAGWIVQLPWWIKVLVYSNPVSYQLDLLRWILLDFHQLSRQADVIVTVALPIIGIVAASWSMARMFKNSEGRPMKRRKPGGP